MLLALGLGLLVGLLIGALGGGGSILTVPLLVFVIGLSAQEATSASLVIVGVSAVVASLSHGATGNTRWRTGLALAAAGVPTSVLGTELNQAVQGRVLLLCFAVVMLVGATGMLLRSRSSSADSSSEPSGRGAWIRLALAGAGIGFLTGFFGVGGGFVIVPVLVVLLALPATEAVGTSLLVVALSTGVALLARAGQGTFDWAVIVPFTLAAVAGALGGQRLADRLPDQVLTRAFAVLLVVVALYTGVRAATGSV